MKKAIDGLLYDTEKAEKVASYSNGLGKSDFGYVREKLFRTSNGRFFLYGEGGAQSRYSKPAGDMRGPGEDIQPLSETEAIEWLEDHNEVEVLKEEFPEHLEPA